MQRTIKIVLGVTLIIAGLIIQYVKFTRADAEVKSLLIHAEESDVTTDNMKRTLAASHTEE